MCKEGTGMHGVAFFITITQRADAEEFSRFFTRSGVSVLYSAACHGTARQKTLSLLGLERTEKTMHFSMVTRTMAKELTRRLSAEMHIDLPGRGIALAVPVSSIGGTTTMNYFLEGQSAQEEAESMEETRYELIVIIAEEGYTDMVMDAARSAGAGGGTVVHAKGTGVKRARQFFGVSIADGKELIFIVAAEPRKKEIMRAVMRGAGVQTKAHALCFSVPVSETAGFRLFEDKAD